ncbi:hypothetical protein BIW11_03626 [Tropilaelaps mercedesae]|uniref:Uncharacterized protein n=1 Tax=Tropilaelaps mercedesae TaxID=418985 RepID=A0A1V9XIE9_9ACAR|nr:hypothetical protein BIW11_03626 [Tropilaelaps mercedesae]
MAAGPPSSANAPHPAHGHTSLQGGAIGAPLQSSTAASHGQPQSQQTQHQHSQQPTTLPSSQQDQPPQLPRRSQQMATAPRTDSRSARQANGVTSPRRQVSKAVTGVNTHGAVAPTPTKASSPLVTPGQRKCHQSEQSGRGSTGHNPSLVDQQGGLGTKARGGSLGHGVPKNGGSARYLASSDNSVQGVTSVSNSSASAANIPTALGKDLAVRVEEVLREMKNIPPLLPLIDDGNSIERVRDREWDKEKLDSRVVQTETQARADHPIPLLSHQNVVSQTALPAVPSIRPFST